MNQISAAHNKREYLRLLETMLLIRLSEERLSGFAKSGQLPGAVHLYIGQEACAVGACSILEDRDWITSTHRGHGHFLAKGGDLRTMFAEIWGKQEGICRGMGGSMHVADFSKGILGANGIVGGGFGIATGAAFGAKLRKDGRVATCFFGDGAANQGTFMESMNIASAWQLPIVFFCENNGLSEFTVSSTVTGGRLEDRAKAFMPTEVVDGNDVLAVQAAMRTAVERARRDEGPSYIEAKTYRIRGHLEAEDAMLGGGTYRTKDDIVAWQHALKDPIPRFEKYLTESGAVDTTEVEELRSKVTKIVDAAVAFADAGTDADVALAHSLMFAGQEA
jgi:acetoin:2,6-dichlorophenolindophenol oxidoreductase subunit alpha